MKKPWLAGILSATVLPGMGQWYVGEKRKGVLIALLFSGILFYIMYAVLVSILNNVDLNTLQPGPEMASLVISHFRALKGPVLTYIMLGIYLWSIVDAVLGAKRVNGINKSGS